MTRELDAEIFHLAGLERPASHRTDICYASAGEPVCDEYDECCSESGLCDYCDHDKGCHEPIAPRYSSDLNALMALIRGRWPDAHVELGCDMVRIWRDYGLFYEYFDSDAEDTSGLLGLFEQSRGDDAERLANAVRDALREGAK